MHPRAAPWHLGRRDFLRYGAGLAVAGFLPALTPSLRAGPPRPLGQARSCILIYLLGGPPHLDMWDLKPEAPAEIRGPFRPIATRVGGLRICEHLPRLATLADRYALIRSVSHPNHNHTPMIYYTLTGRLVEQPNLDNDIRPPQRIDAPHLGAILAYRKETPRGLPGYIAIPELAIRSSTRGEFKRARTLLRGGGAGLLGPLVDPLGVNNEPGAADGIPALTPPRDVAAERFERRTALLSVLEGRPLAGTRLHQQVRHQAVALTGAASARAGLFTLDGEPPPRRERYGDHRFGKALLLARRLAEAEVPMVAIHFNEMTVCDGWDTHSKNFEALQTELLPMVDQGVSALLEDLAQRGLLEQTVVVVMGEFGRTPRINAAAGRDHWGSCQSVLLAGGGIQGGRVHGASDRVGAFPAVDPVDPVDLHATIYHLMGLRPDEIIYDYLRRPLPLTTGRVLEALL
ncbi:MAG: DUF1501 domain-containing protein [Gemmataceae bacterium]